MVETMEGILRLSMPEGEDLEKMDTEKAKSLIN